MAIFSARASWAADCPRAAGPVVPGYPGSLSPAAVFAFSKTLGAMPAPSILMHGSAGALPSRRPAPAGPTSARFRQPRRSGPGHPAATGFIVRVVIGFWYGRQRFDLNLGGQLHLPRWMRLISSQVSSIAPELTAAGTKPALSSRPGSRWLEVERARFITHRFPITQAAQAYALIDNHPEDVIQVILTY